MERWRAYRAKHLQKYLDARRTGAVDPPMVPLLDVLNGRENYVTTSSCSGRITLLSTAPSERKGETFFYRKWHRPVLFDEVWDAIREYRSGGRLILKLDPFILHVGARDLDSALLLLRVARSAGVKIAGIQSVDDAKVHLEIRGIDSVALPVWDESVLVSEKYVRYLVHYLNWKMIRNQQRLERLYDAVITEL